MSIPLKDFRLAVPEDVLAVLEAEAAAFDTDMQAIARKVLQEFADRRAHAFKVYQRRVLANGLQTELPGFEAGDAGTARKLRR